MPSTQVWRIMGSYVFGCFVHSRSTVDLKNLKLPHTLSLFIRQIFSTIVFSHAPADFSVGFGDGLLPVHYVRSGMQIIIIIIGCCTIALRASYCHLFDAEVIHRTKQSSVWAEFAKRWEKIVFVYQSATWNWRNVCNKKRGSPIDVTWRSSAQNKQMEKESKLFANMWCCIERAATIRRRIYISRNRKIDVLSLDVQCTFEHILCCVLYIHKCTFCRSYV